MVTLEEYDFSTPPTAPADENYGETIVIDGPVEVGEELRPPLPPNDLESSEPVAAPPKRTRRKKADDESDESSEPKPKKQRLPRGGTGRATATLERDAIVLGLLSTVSEDDGAVAALTRSEISEKLGIAENLVYLSLYRLGRDGKITRIGAGSKAKWSAATSATTNETSASDETADSDEAASEIGEVADVVTEEVTAE